jgi:anti-anti-sigma factor
MELSHSQEGSVSVVALRGRFDQASADSVHQALLPYINECRSDGKPLLLDFSDVAYISSVGLRVLIMAAKQVKSQSGRVAIANLTPIVAEVFQIGRFNLVFRVFPSNDEALSFLQS